MRIAGRDADEDVFEGECAAVEFPEGPAVAGHAAEDFFAHVCAGFQPSVKTPAPSRVRSERTEATPGTSARTLLTCSAGPQTSASTNAVPASCVSISLSDLL